MVQLRWHLQWHFQMNNKKYEITTEQIYTLKKMLGCINACSNTVKRRLTNGNAIEPVCETIKKLIATADKIIEDVTGENVSIIYQQIKTCKECYHIPDICETCEKSPDDCNTCKNRCDGCPEKDTK